VVKVTSKKESRYRLVDEPIMNGNDTCRAHKTILDHSCTMYIFQECADYMGSEIVICSAQV